MKVTKLFVKVPLELLSLGLPRTLLLLYARLRLYAGENGKCHPKHSTLAKEFRVSRRHILYLLGALQRLRLIEWTRGPHFNWYRVLDPDVKWISHQMRNGFHISDVKSTSHRKDSSSKEARKRSPQPPAAHREPPAGRTQNAKRVDDDEPKSQPRPLSLSPEQEFRDRLKERHGTLCDADGCVQAVQRQLEKCFGLSMTEFLAFDAQHTTAPDVIRNPNGYYTQLAKNLRRSAVAAARAAADEPLRRAAAAAPPEPERNEHGWCKRCGGPGRLADGGFCTCPIGRGLEKQERLAARPKATKKGTAGQYGGKHGRQ
jgi:hypothetical protein